MKADVIVEKVLADAKAAAGQIIAEARRKTGELQQASESRIEAGVQRVRERARQDGEAERVRMQRMAELEERKRDLADKRGVLDLVFSGVIQQLEEGDPAALRAILLRMAAGSAAGTETLLVGDAHSGWFDSGFVAELNRALCAKGLPGQIRLSPEKAPGVTGLILRENGADLAITPAEIVAAVRPDMEPDIAKVCFPGDGE